ncbi:MAG: hypothetical protein ACKOYG_10020, partial [Ilumatobacteraceae bacterium]
MSSLSSIAWRSAASGAAMWMAASSLSAASPSSPVGSEAPVHLVSRALQAPAAEVAGGCYDVGNVA